VGEEVVFGVSTTPVTINLKVLVQTPYDASQEQSSQPAGVLDNYITIFADGADIGIVVGISQLLVGTVSLSAQGTVSATGGYSGATGVCHRIPAGAERRYLMQNSQDNWLGVVGSATGTVRLFQSNPAAV
jgi:hypothetical protein